MIFGTQEQLVERRSGNRDNSNYNGPERRQFADGRENSRPEVAELAEAVDQYKLQNRRRFISYDELYDLMIELGYRKAL